MFRTLSPVIKKQIYHLLQKVSFQRDGTILRNRLGVGQLEHETIQGLDKIISSGVIGGTFEGI